ncbi:MAG: 6,7-dimethyl-8-ribityllumazine synthase [Deltaproteobacteria bacterium]|nr:MAG: 6,7-dimethyl-8-ribityllumazine synthase [Deltaproteobacteria bacterium]
MPRTFEGHLTDPGGRFAIVGARFNHFIVERLVEGAVDALRRHGVDVEERVDIVWVPGAWEVPVVCQRLASSGRYAAIITCATVIRGSTAHFDFVAGEVAKGTGAVSTQTGVPIAFGVLTTDTIEQAIERAGTKAGNKGFEAGCVAIEMVSLLARLEV